MSTGLVIGVRPHAIADPRSKIRGVRAASGVDDDVATPTLDRRPRAALGARVLRVDGLRGPAPGVDANLDHLPVPRVPAGPEDPAVLVLPRMEEPVLQPRPAAVATRRARVDRRGAVVAPTGSSHRCRRHAAERQALTRVENDDRREGGEGSGAGRGGEQRP